MDSEPWSFAVGPDRPIIDSDFGQAGTGMHVGVHHDLHVDGGVLSPVLLDLLRGVKHWAIVAAGVRVVESPWRRFPADPKTGAEQEMSSWGWGDLGTR
jgi:hypothetical protein